MGVNIILIIAGLIICFGGIYFKKFVSGLLGLFWGAVIGIIITFITAGSLLSIDEEGLLIAVVVCGVIFAILSAVYDKLCVAINSFVSSFLFVMILLTLLANFDEFMPMAIIALIVAIVISAISVRIADYSHILITAFSGAFIASVGFLGVTENADLSEMLVSIMWSGFDGFGIVLGGTIVLGFIGFFVQLKRLGIIKSESHNAAPMQMSAAPTTAHIVDASSKETVTNTDWKCSCGQINNSSFCEKCGSAKNEIKN